MIGFGAGRASLPAEARSVNGDSEDGNSEWSRFFRMTFRGRGRAAEPIRLTDCSGLVS